MGQKTHPKGFRLGIIRDWDSRWYARRQEFVDLLLEDQRIRRHIKKRLYDAGISRVEIERAANRVRITIHAGKPGMVIGKGGTGVEALRQDLERMTGRQVAINVVEVKEPELDAQLVAESIAAQIERRISWRRAMKQALQRAMRAGAKGCKIRVSGRLGGAEISRSEWTAEGSVPLHTLRADIDYGQAEAFTTYGQIGVKVWINRGEVLPEAKREAAPAEQGAQGGR
ncbi:SSU ribosomal protein S3P [Thermaerobacter marianensis DSM 12885]|uniref:Small ribosomal subunit protein uS3 n=1 Tax=Thermaerobacter marianensis (strain ATCC 700841 / DSM 12885 / JCM 10246 / 7p75a) TaxID=644966 RepID=E6SKZ4_THEM7|nr:30S ribosomal protein S3 [Thermaerobacter marianensis]ADU52367.1 SSU ribosomal protein S3P [Thermaerobacter marianensis DSM 12885]